MPIKVTLVAGLLGLFLFFCSSSFKADNPPATKPAPLTYIYDQRNNPQILGVAETSESKFGAYLRESHGSLLTANVPDSKPIALGSMIWTGIIDVTRSTLPGTQINGGTKAFVIDYSAQGRSPYLTLIDPDELDGLIAYIEYAKKNAESYETDPKPVPMSFFSTRGGFKMTICVWTKKLLTTDLTLGGQQLGLLRNEFDGFEAAVRQARDVLKPKAP